LFLGMICAYKYPLTREKYTKICKELEERRKG
jgi:Na+/melibiose symporter-like transporter